jgi:hypothetical protein
VTEDDWDPDLYITDGPIISSTPPRVAKRKAQFVRLPLVAVDIMAKTSKDKLMPIYCHVLYESWRTGGGPVTLANGFLEQQLGISPDAKIHALHRLKEAGLVSVDFRKNKNPIVTVLGSSL